MIILYNRRLTKESGVLSDFESLFGYEKQNSVVRDFLKELIGKEAIIENGKKAVNNNVFETYKVNKKILKQLIEDNKKLCDEIYFYIEDDVSLIIK